MVSSFPQTGSPICEVTLRGEERVAAGLSAHADAKVSGLGVGPPEPSLNGIPVPSGVLGIPDVGPRYTPTQRKNETRK